MATGRVIGVCAMERKSRSRPMRDLLQRLMSGGDFECIIFGDKVILDEAVETWPMCDFLLAFFSKGFPLQKAIDYCALRRPFCINNLTMQKLLFDRRLVLKLLDAVGIPTPRRLILNRDGGPQLADDVRELLRAQNINIDTYVDSLEAGSVVHEDNDDTISINGQVLRKPFVEKPVSGEDHNVWIYYPGGGVRKLFRKVANKSSEYVASVSKVRSAGSFVYEEFMDVDNAEDVKVYTVGPSNFHAETRKSPVIDGIVRRNPEGKEMRYVTALNDSERLIAEKVCTSFGQTVCGFDLLRAGGASYVIDVNGWSFVKGNDEYYDMCAGALRALFTQHVAAMRTLNIPLSREPSFESQWRLKAFLCVFRHGDRTPKQKIKYFAHSQPFVNLLSGSVDEVVLKKPEELVSVLAAVDEARNKALEDAEQMTQLAVILQKKMMYPGTKVQVKPYFSKFDGLLEKIQVVIKWGGEFTHAGFHHTKDLGENMRKDLLLINKDVFGDVRTLCSSERRVAATADVFLKSFMDLVSTGESSKDLVTTRKDMLDDSFAAKELLEATKIRLQSILNRSDALEVVEKSAAHDADGICHPGTYVDQVIELLRSRREVMQRAYEVENVDLIQSVWCCSENPNLFKERWDRLFRDFCDVERVNFDPSKVSELFDSLKYDALHNREFIERVFVDQTVSADPRAPLRELYQKAKLLVDYVSPREYGLTAEDKLDVGVLISRKLLEQMVADLESARDADGACCRLYFTKESHVHALYNALMLCLPPGIAPVAELDYLTQITLELYERTRLMGSEDAPLEYSLRVGFSPGAHDAGLIDTQMDYRHALSVTARHWITDHVHLGDALQRIKHGLANRASAEHTRAVTPKLVMRTKQ